MSRSPRRASRLAVLINVLCGVALVAGLAMLYPPVSRSPHFEYKLGDVTQTGEEVIAPISFPVPIKPSVLAEQRAAASLSVPPVYRRDPAVARQLAQKLERLRAERDELRKHFQEEGPGSK